MFTKQKKEKNIALNILEVKNSINKNHKKLDSILNGINLTKDLVSEPETFYILTNMKRILQLKLNLKVNI